MDPKSDEDIFLGYSTNSRAYRVFNSRTNVLMESINVIMDDKEEGVDVIEDVGTFLDTSTDIPVQTEDVQDTPHGLELEASNKVPSIRIQKDHPKDLIIGDPNSGVTTRSREISSNS